MSEVNYMRTLLPAKCECGWEGQDIDCEKTFTEENGNQIIVNTKIICPKCSGENTVQIGKYNDQQVIEVKEENKIDPKENFEQVQKELETFKTNPENKKKAILLAQQFELILNKKKGSWFSLRQLSKRVKETEQEMLIKLKMLQIFDLCIAKEWRSTSKFRKGELVFRINIGLAEQIQSMDEIIEQLKAETEGYIAKREELKQQLNG